MNHTYKAKRVLRNNTTEETGEIAGPDAFAMAMRQAEFWATKPESKTVSLLRADTRGVNAGKFFLHLFVKA